MTLRNNVSIRKKQGRKRPLDTPKRMIERREREGEREKEGYKERYKKGGRDKRDRDREREVKGIESERENKILVKSPNPRNKAQRKVDYKNYNAITMRRNYQEK